MERFSGGREQDGFYSSLRIDLGRANTYMKKYSISLVTGGTQIKTTRYHLIPIRMTIIKKHR